MAVLCDMHSLGFFMFLSMNDISFTRMLICCCCNLMFYDWSECVMSVLGTTKHSSCNCIDTWQKSYFVLYCTVIFLAVYFSRGSQW